MISMKRYILWTLVISLVWVLSGLAQTSTCGITGIVADQSGSVVAGVTVTVAYEKTGQRFVVTTNGAGVYVIASLQPGDYSLQAAMPNFNSVEINGIKLDPGIVIKQDIALSVSNLAQKVNVQAQATLVNTAGGETGGIITPEQIQNIDVNGRNYQALASLIPGVNNIQAGQQLSGLGLQNGIVISSNGLAINKNLFTVDGSFNMNIGNEAEGAVNPELDIIQEVSIVADNYSAKYGYSAGAQVMVETKSGGQKFHGGAQEYIRNNSFDARNTFAAAVSPLKQNIFGYNVGGPVFIPNVYNTKKEKTFFFWAQNWRVVRQGLLGLGATPTVAMRNGDFSQEALRIGKPILDPVTKEPFPNNQVPANRMDPNALLFLNQLFSLPNNPAGGFNNFLNDSPNKTHQHQALARIDHTFSEKVRVMARYIREDTYNAKPFGNFAPSVFPSAATETDTLGKNVYVRITATPTPRVVNNLSYGFSQTNVDGFPLGNGSVLPLGSTYTPVLANQDNGHRIPDLTFAGGWTTGGIGTTDSFTDARDQAHTYADDFSYATGRHILQAGMMLNYAIVTQAVGTTPQGAFNFSGAFSNDPIADFLLGYAATYTQNSKSRRGDLRYFQFEPYFQDDWKVTKRLTLNLGVRWAYIPPWYLLEATTAFIPQLYDPAKAPLLNNSGQMTLTPNYSNTNGLAFSGESSLKVPRGFAKTPLNTWMPRFGFAWDIFGDGKTSVRGGIGITYYRNEDSVWGTLNNPPISSSVSLVNTSLTNPGGSTALGPLLPSNVSNIPYTMTSSRVATYSLGLQREVGLGTVLHLAFAGSQAIHLPFSRDMNQPLRTDGFDFDPRLNANSINTNAIRPYLGYGSISTKFSDGTSHYDSLQVGVVHRYSRNFSFQLAYTWGKIIGRGNDVDAVRQDAYAPRADQGLSKIDRTHIFNIGYVYDLPFYRTGGGALRVLLGGWGISGLTQIDSGFALTPTLATGDRGLAARPSVSGQPLFGSGTRTIATWFNPATFIAPPAGFFGNAANGGIRGPGLIDFDFSMNKHTRLYKDRIDSEFRAEFYNILNHPNLLGVSTALGSGTYGRVTSALDPRIMEFGFKVRF